MQALTLNTLRDVSDTAPVADMQGVATIEKISLVASGDLYNCSVRLRYGGANGSQSGPYLIEARTASPQATAMAMTIISWFSDEEIANANMLADVVLGELGAGVLVREEGSTDTAWSFLTELKSLKNVEGDDEDALFHGLHDDTPAVRDLLARHGKWDELGMAYVADRGLDELPESGDVVPGDEAFRAPLVVTGGLLADIRSDLARAPNGVAAGFERRSAEVHDFIEDMDETVDWIASDFEGGDDFSSADIDEICMSEGLDRHDRLSASDGDFGGYVYD